GGGGGGGGPNGGSGGNGGGGGFGGGGGGGGGGAGEGGGDGGNGGFGGGSGASEPANKASTPSGPGGGGGGLGGAIFNQGGTVTVANSILTFAGPSSTLHNYQDTPAATALLNATGPNIVLGLVANHNGTVSGTPFAAVDPLLGPLQNNGGPTPTMALLPGSPA